MIRIGPPAVALVLGALAFWSITSRVVAIFVWWTRLDRHPEAEEVTAQKLADMVRDPLWLIRVPMEVRIEKAKRTAQRYDIPWADVQRILEPAAKDADA